MKTNVILTRKMGEFISIIGFDEYLVSPNGEVFSYKSNKILKLNKMSNGYLFVALRKDGKTFQKTIHRLVAKMFISNKDNLPCVDHIDGTRTNNNVNNLRWCTQQQNLTYPIATKRRKTAQSNELCKLKVRFGKQRNNVVNQDKPVIAVNFDGEYFGSWNSIREAGKDTGIDYSSIAKCCRGKYKTAGGLKWRCCPF